MSDRDTSAYGGRGWEGRGADQSVWGRFGCDSEWSRLKSVVLHRPGSEVAVEDPDAALFLEIPDPDRASRQHAALEDSFSAAGIRVYRRPITPPFPNFMFQADLFFMTPRGAILGRPAARARAGEEVEMALTLSHFRIPILHTVTTPATFEGADAAWLAKDTVLLGRGLRTNREGVRQVEAVMRLLGVNTLSVDLPSETMHLMGQLRFLDRDLAILWPDRAGDALRGVLEEHGFNVLEIPDEREAEEGMALNFVTLAPRKVLIPSGNSVTKSFLEQHGVECISVDVSEITKAAGAIGCLTGVVERTAC